MGRHANSPLLSSCTPADTVRRSPAEVVAALLRRASYLPPRDEALVRMTCDGQSQRTIASLLGIPAGTVSRRYQRLRRRLADPLVIALIDAPHDLPPDVQQIGIEHFLVGRSLSHLAAAHHLPPRELTDTLAFLRGWHKAMKGRRA